MVGRVYEAVRSSALMDDVIIATDSEEIMGECQRHGWKAQMTSTAHRSGTERVHEISCLQQADVYLNVQGDEPLTRAEHIAALLAVMKDPDVQVGTLKTPAPEADINNPNAVKVVTDSSGKALYFSRATIPHDRDHARPRYFKHLGFYAYRKPALDRFVTLSESSLERSERLEQLRFLENGIAICVGETSFDTVGVDTEEDVVRVENLLRKR
jgi:3-deoxy-manno-octulosonate cytidylyltransferase (CMP-KDO synthetase)